MLPCRYNPQHEQYEGATDWHNARGEPVALRLEPDRDDPKLPMAPAARAARQRIDADPDEWQKRLTVFLGDTHPARPAHGDRRRKRWRKQYPAPLR